MSKDLAIAPPWFRVGRNRRSEFIPIHPCDRKLPKETEPVSALPLETIRVIRGNYSWSIPVRMFAAVKRVLR